MTTRTELFEPEIAELIERCKKPDFIPSLGLSTDYNNLMEEICRCATSESFTKNVPLRYRRRGVYKKWDGRFISEYLNDYKRTPTNRSEYLYWLTNGAGTGSLPSTLTYRGPRYASDVENWFVKSAVFDNIPLSLYVARFVYFCDDDSRKYSPKSFEKYAELIDEIRKCNPWVEYKATRGKDVTLSETQKRSMSQKESQKQRENRLNVIQKGEDFIIVNSLNQPVIDLSKVEFLGVIVDFERQLVDELSNTLDRATREILEARIATLHIIRGQGDSYERYVEVNQKYPPRENIIDENIRPVSSTIAIAIRAGLHVRPATLVAQFCSLFEGKITLADAVSGKTADAKSLLELLLLAAPVGTELIVNAKCKDAEIAARGLTKLLGSEFDYDSYFENRDEYISSLLRSEGHT